MPHFLLVFVRSVRNTGIKINLHNSHMPSTLSQLFVMCHAALGRLVGVHTCILKWCIWDEEKKKHSPHTAKWERRFTRRKITSVATNNKKNTTTKNLEKSNKNCLFYIPSLCIWFFTVDFSHSRSVFTVLLCIVVPSQRMCFFVLNGRMTTKSSVFCFGQESWRVYAINNKPLCVCCVYVVC